MFWDQTKNDWLIEHRGLSFEAVVAALEAGEFLDDFAHPRRANQRLLVVELHGYVCAVRDGDKIFLKTIYPDRDLMAKYRSSK